MSVLDFESFSLPKSDGETADIILSLPQPVEVKKLDNGKWCVRITDDGIPLTAFGDTVTDAGMRMLKILGHERPSE